MDVFLILRTTGFLGPKTIYEVILKELMAKLCLFCLKTTVDRRIPTPPEIFERYE